ncbi:hypothetical protein [Limosilactobacillus antri]|uniref:hypothetical protein n=1 Tax=Limosilactobacillus antri TaxID=227943 RepID=UPI001F565423|nr:hypothetical protein [Limosilactobacillus antri]
MSKKYVLRWFDDAVYDEDAYEGNYLAVDEYGRWFITGPYTKSVEFDEVTLQSLEENNPKLIPAIEAMKVEVTHD